MRERLLSFGPWKSTLVVVWLACSMPALCAQEAPQPGQPTAPIERRSPTAPTFHVESRLVSFALNVVDEHSAPVPGLTVADFELSEESMPQRIAVFDRESTTPLEIVLAVDASGSVLDDERLERDAARTFARALVRPQDRIDLMQFSDNVDELVGFTNDVKRFDAGLAHIERGSATALYDAIYLASQRLSQTDASKGQRRVVVLVTDGENTTRHGTYDAALEQAERAGAMIFSLIVVPIDADAGRNTGGEHALIQMSNDTGGKYYYVEDKHDLGPALQHVSDDLRTQYTLGYYAPEARPGQAPLRHIQLRLKDPILRARYTLRYRTAYYANH